MRLIRAPGKRAIVHRPRLYECWAPAEAPLRFRQDQTEDVGVPSKLENRDLIGSWHLVTYPSFLVLVVIYICVEFSLQSR